MNEIERELSSCYLTQFGFSVIGTIVGVGVGVKTKSYKPLVVGITTGSIADYGYSKFYACKDIQEKYDEMLKNVSKKDDDDDNNKVIK